MNRRVWWVMAVLCALVVLAPQAMAQQPPETDPPSGDIVQHIAQRWDRSALPVEVELLAPKTLLGYSKRPEMGLGELHLTCRSNSDPATGSCPVSDTGENGSYRSRVPLRFVEQRSGLPTEVNVEGWLDRAESGRGCNDYWQPHVRPLWTTFSAACVTPASGTALSLRIPAAELRQLVAGRWKANLELSLRDGSGGSLARYIFVFDFTITDYNAVSIYFPLFDQVTPHVGLNLQYDPLAQTVGGRTQLDMCLYDGLGSQSQYLGVTVRDSGPRPPGPSGYSVWHTDGGSDATQRVDYTVTLDHNGSAIPLRNGVEQLLHGIDTAKLRLVLLPGMTQPVFCVPTPLTLDTPRVPVSSKRPGYYDGDLKVELRVPTVTP
ncbi:pilin protein [Stenotrophomonas sp. GD03993]|nr:pilin protein [Stenotrophomonas sp. GD04051]MDH0466072.1 pilin protein [Stenotrophomonas sp. GD03993]MDH0878294.1 pilin protein [Stenotrophomonas sp. GD03877]MDH2156703.1 pilin protein [Stenotrophomonas sp. GD03657]UQA21741.1 pilin protein [Stenotrophomonas sp. NY11291]